MKEQTVKKTEQQIIIHLTSATSFVNLAVLLRD